jgi:orotidine-5'-phosphate decarboxylase
MEKIVSKSFWLKYQNRYQELGSHVCVGLDSRLDLLPPCLQKADNPIWHFNRAIIDATADYATAYKPNLAFYLADGIRGLEALYKTVSYIPSQIPVILDCKVGDIGSTMQGYVEAFFKDIKVDAITINPLMGKDVLLPLLEHEGSFAFALALTSNPSADDFFHKADMRHKVASWLADFDESRLGAVVGATQVSHLQEMRMMMPGRLFLIPGVGAQGGDLDAVLRYAIDSPADPRILINSSRGIIFASRDTDFATVAGMKAKELYRACKG